MQLNLILPSGKHSFNFVCGNHIPEAAQLYHVKPENPGGKMYASMHEYRHNRAYSFRQPLQIMAPWFGGVKEGHACAVLNNKTII